MKKIKSSFCIIFLAMFCFMFTACSTFEVPDGEEGEYDSVSSVLNEALIATTGNGDETGEEAKTLLSDLTENLLNSLLAEYGESATNVFSRSADDTHVNAVAQDVWNWNINTASFAELKSYLQYQFAKVLLGEEPLSFTPNDFSDLTSEYQTLKTNGEFSEENLLALAKKLQHTGFFSYELDNLAEFVLKNVIGEDVLTRDLMKFSDQNNNQTFDYVEKFVLPTPPSIPYSRNIILSYDSTYPKSTKNSKNGVWNRIKWGENAEGVPAITDDPEQEGQREQDTIKASQITAEEALTLAEIEAKATIYAVDISPEDIAQRIVIKNSFKQQQTGDIATAKFSGFKNYQNTIYFTLYSLANLEIPHKPNITTQKRKMEDLEYDYDNEENPFKLPFDNYKSIVVTSKFPITLLNFEIIVQSDQEVEEMELEISMRYHFVNDANRQYIGDYTGPNIAEASLGIIKVAPNAEADFLVWFHSPEEDPEELNDLMTAGIYALVLNGTRSLGPLFAGFDVLESGGYVANPSPTFQGSTFSYASEYLDYLEFVFDVKPTEHSNPKFRFAIDFF